VWRLSFDPVTETVGNLTLLAGGAGGLAGNRVTATALGPDGNLYVGFLRNGNILRITNPSGTTQLVQTAATTSDGRGLSALAFVGPDLYAAEGGAVTKVANAASCSACKAVATTSSAAAPTALASDGKSVLYIAETPAIDSAVLRFNVATGAEITFSNTGVFPDGTTTSYKFVTGLSVDNAGNLFVGDDPTDGAQIIQGHVWRVLTN
jgi:sugar lactone lactonase YvrE